MTDTELVQLQEAYGSSWNVRIPPNGHPTATRRRDLSPEELGAELVMTLAEDQIGLPGCESLADQLAKQQRIEDELTAAALADESPTSKAS